MGQCLLPALPPPTPLPAVGPRFRTGMGASIKHTQDGIQSNST